MSRRSTGCVRPARRHRRAGSAMRAVRRGRTAAVQAAAEGLRRAGEGARLRLLHDVRPRRGTGVWSIYGALRIRLDLPTPAGGEPTAASSARGTRTVLQRRVQKAQ